MTSMNPSYIYYIEESYIESYNILILLDSIRYNELLTYIVVLTAYSNRNMLYSDI